MVYIIFFHQFRLHQPNSTRQLDSAARSYESLHKVTMVLIEHRFGAIPVLNNEGELVGVLSATDLLQALEMLIEEQKLNKNF